MAFKGVELREEIKTMVDLSACICFSKEECRVYFGNHNKVGAASLLGIQNGPLPCHGKYSKVHGLVVFTAYLSLST